MTNAVCTTYEVVTAATSAFADGKWYVVTNGSEIARGRITVSGSAHLILCDGGSLEVEGGNRQAGVSVPNGVALTIYGQVGYEWIDSTDVSTGGFKADVDYSSLVLSAGVQVRF